MGRMLGDPGQDVDYMLKRWPAFTRFLDDGRICLSNNAAERWRRRAGSMPGDPSSRWPISLPPPAAGRKAKHWR